jgi:hypothetical protein
VSPWIVVLVADDRAMNNQNPSTRVRLRVVDPTEYLIQRMVVLAAVGALLALVAVSTLEGTGAQVEATWIGLLIFGMVAVIASASRRRTQAAAVGIEQADRPSTETGSFVGWALASQLGPDPEQVIGRHTGART